MTDKKNDAKTSSEAKARDIRREVILVLEDSHPNQNILRLILEKLGYRVLAGDNGVMGVELLDRCINEELNLVAIISDIMMPEMDGLKFLEHVKTKSEAIQAVPFVFVTAASDKDNVLEAKRLGVTSYLLKPVTMEKIRTKLQELFPQRPFPVVRNVG